MTQAISIIIVSWLVIGSTYSAVLRADTPTNMLCQYWSADSSHGVDKWENSQPIGLSDMS